MNRLKLLSLTTLILTIPAVLRLISQPATPTPTSHVARLLQRQMVFRELAAHLPPSSRPAPSGPESLTVAGTPVDRVTDPRGSVFFRTNTQPDSLGPDTLCSGHAFQPNRQGTPFDRAHYRLSPISTD